jgi:hypothetical protein
MSTTRERYLEWKNRSLLPQLPVEIWSQIFSYLDIYDLFSVRLVSRLFYSCINQHTHFWSCVILDIDQCPSYLVASDIIRNIRSSNIDLFTKSNLYIHCTLYLKPQPPSNSINKRRKRRLFIANEHDEQMKKQSYLRCSSVCFQSLRLFDQLQLECLLKKRIRRLEFSYECLSTESSLMLLVKLERLKHLKISFIHNIIDRDSFALMLINTMRDVIIVLFRLKRYMMLCF